MKISHTSFSGAIAAVLALASLGQATPARRGLSKPHFNIDLLKSAPRILSKEPTVVPGPGFPSVASLGLTSANLFDNHFMAAYIANKTAHEHANKRSPSPVVAPALPGQGLTKRSTDVCLHGFGGVGYGTLSGIYACYNYLNALGTTGCGAGRDGVIMCQAGGNGFMSYVSGSADRTDFAASYCRDVATAVAFGINNCAWCPGGWPDCVLQSEAAAYGNGDLAIATWGTAYP